MAIKMSFLITAKKSYSPEKQNAEKKTEKRKTKNAPSHGNSTFFSSRSRIKNGEYKKSENRKYANPSKNQFKKTKE